MRALAFLLAWTATLAAAPFTKPSQPHARAVRAHLGLGQKPDLAEAVKLYNEACQQKYPPSCNNLAVLALAGKTSSDKPEDVFAAACKKLDNAACENERRLAGHREAAVRLSLIPALALDDKGRAEQHALACKAGDLYECEDATTKSWVGKVFADECRGGHTTECATAARATEDPAEQVKLLDLGCKAKDARACFEVGSRKKDAKAWAIACSDADWPTLDADRADRLTACRAWSDKAKALAAVDAYCKAGEDEACMVGAELADKAGNAKRAFELTKLVCERTPTMTKACEALGARYLLGRGTPRAVDKRIALLGETCVAPAPWAECKLIAAYEAAHKKDGLDAMPIYAAFCAAGETEACYLKTRKLEANEDKCRLSLKDGALDDIAKAYDALCAAKYGDACARRKTLCKLAMDEYAHSADQCGWGIGDGTWRSSPQRDSLIALCPRDVWRPDVVKTFAADHAP